MTVVLSMTLACSCQAVLSHDFPVQPSALQGLQLGSTVIVCRCICSAQRIRANYVRLCVTPGCSYKTEKLWPHIVACYERRAASDPDHVVTTREAYKKFKTVCTSNGQPGHILAVFLPDRARIQSLTMAITCSFSGPMISSWYPPGI